MSAFDTDGRHVVLMLRKEIVKFSYQMKSFLL